MKLLSSLFTLIAFLQIVNSAHALFGWHPVRGYDYPYANTQYVQDVAAQTAADVAAGVARTTPPVSYPVTGQPMYQTQYRSMPQAPEGRLMNQNVSPTARYYNQ